MPEPRRRFLDRAFWMLIYGYVVLATVDQMGSWHGWIVVICVAVMAGMHAAAEAGDRSNADF